MAFDRYPFCDITNTTLISAVLHFIQVLLILSWSQLSYAIRLSISHYNLKYYKISSSGWGPSLLFEMNFLNG